MFYKGDRVVIVTRRHGHLFEIGEEVEIVDAVYSKRGDGGSYSCKSVRGTSRWAVTDEEIEPAAPSAHEVQEAIESIKRVQQ